MKWKYQYWLNLLCELILKALVNQNIEAGVFHPEFPLVQDDVNSVECRGVGKGHVTPPAWPGGLWWKMEVPRSVCLWLLLLKPLHGWESTCIHPRPELAMGTNPFDTE